jgi:hypothetical protein
MIVKTLESAGKALRFLVLIPQGNAAPLKALKRDLFAAGCPGAWSFPGLAPLALVSRPFGKAELGALASAIRYTSMVDGREGKIRPGKTRMLECPGLPGILGPLLDLPPPVLPPEGVLFPFPALILAAALADPGDIETERKAADIISRMEPFSFSAAAVANMILEPLVPGDADPLAPCEPEPEKGYSFRWKIGEPRWLPALKP